MFGPEEVKHILKTLCPRKTIKVYLTLKSVRGLLYFSPLVILVIPTWFLDLERLFLKVLQAVFLPIKQKLPHIITNI